ncbi:ubiquitin carboxyl-terminal hydrolase 47-like isoform X1 [Paralichthys olivaceus]|uniref:ubiquitin carboxyl-terminal hydrolase 47-like isoform X1 n=2 Tax=Paralichthys olivaceus TaxID=8255 RepID=UPI0037520A02
MNHELVETFRKKLDNLTISDYHGLNSPGLTCYLNSVLQLLFMTEDFRASIKRCCSKDSTTIDALLKKLFDDLERSLAQTHCLTKKLGIVDVFKQRDAAEYFEKILCLTSPEASKIFKGQLNHKITCVWCKKTNDSRGFFWILPLAVENSSRQTYSVERGLMAFFSKEKVYGENRMYCTQCDKKQDAVIDCEMTENPKILALLLKRFAFDYGCRQFVKLHCEVDVPQTLHMQDCKYDLYALVHHVGNLTGGHYTAEIKSFETGEWYCFDDDIVDMVKPLFGSGNSVRSYTAYLLLYRKVTTQPENADEVDQEVQCAQADVDDEAEGEEAPDPHRTPSDESCSGSENVHHLKKSCGDSSGKLQQQPNQGEAWVRRHKDAEVDGHMLLTEKSHFSNSQKEGGFESNRRRLETNSEHITTHFVDSMFELTHNYQNKTRKDDDITWDKNGEDNRWRTTGSSPRVRPLESKHVKNRREVGAEISIDGKDILTPGHVLPIHYINCRVNEPADLRTHSSNVKRNDGEGWKLEATQTVTAGEKTAHERKRESIKKHKETKQKQPWR